MPAFVQPVQRLSFQLIPAVDDFVRRYDFGSGFVVISGTCLMSEKNISLLHSGGYNYIIGLRIKKASGVMGTASHLRCMSRGVRQHLVRERKSSRRGLFGGAGMAGTKAWNSGMRRILSEAILAASLPDLPLTGLSLVRCQAVLIATTAECFLNTVPAILFREDCTEELPPLFCCLRTNAKVVNLSQDIQINFIIAFLRPGRAESRRNIKIVRRRRAGHFG